MKKQTKQIIESAISKDLVEAKETDFEILTRIVINGFEESRKGQAKLEQGQAKLEQGQAKLEQGYVRLEQGYVRLEQGYEELRQEVIALKDEQKETNRHRLAMEKKQLGTLLSLDETVHRNEFNKIVHRVEALEKR